MLKVTLKRAFKGIWRFHGVAEVDGKEVASAEMMVAPNAKEPVESKEGGG
jgi:3-hydroxymyristoyl/3-hydroxydecanoyl-(acyl carrier protein) dehydratase